MRGNFSKRDPDENVLDVRLIELIALPEKFDRKRVQFIGFLTLLPEGHAIYLHREDFQRHLLRHAIWINIPADLTLQQQRELGMRYVICLGEFRASFRGHMKAFSGSVTNVERLDAWFEESTLPTE